MKTKLILTLIVLGCFTFVYVAFMHPNGISSQKERGVVNHENNRDTSDNQGDSLISYENTDLGVSFAYQGGEDGYVQMDVFEESEDLLDAVVLVKKAAWEELQASTEPREGPPQLALYIFAQASDDNLATWLDTHSAYTNTALILGDMEETEVDGKEALAYQIDGLYRNDIVAVQHKGRVYLFMGAWQTEDDGMQDDFAKLLASVQLI